MLARTSCLLVCADHPADGLLDSREFARRIVGVTTHAFVRDDQLWAVARILDEWANKVLEAGAVADTGMFVRGRLRCAD